MRLYSIKSLFIVFLFFYSLWAGTVQGQLPNRLSPDDKQNKRVILAREFLREVISSMPFSLELPFFLKKHQQIYQSSLLPQPQQNNPTSIYHKAFMLGVHTTCLNYANAYSQKKDAIRILKSMEAMAGKLSVGQHLNVKKITKLYEDKEDYEALLNETNISVGNMANHWHNLAYADLSILFVAGNWLESLHLLCSHAQKSTNKKLNDRIANKKIELVQLLLLLYFYEKKPKIKTLIAELTKLQKTFNQVSVSFVYRNPVVVGVSQEMITVKDNTTTIETYDKKTLQEIFRLVKEIREKMIRNK